ncbi:MAG: efflux RND transporter periplasmic adaptor subunit [Xanthobacteraceae bacterium]
MTQSGATRITATATAIFVLAGVSVLGTVRPLAAADEKSGGAVVIVTPATNACFSDRVRVAGFLVPASEAIATVDSDGYKITAVLVGEGDTVANGQALAQLSRQGAPNTPATTATLKSPVAGIVTRRATMVGSMASPQAEPLFRIMVDGRIELEVEVPSAHLPKLKPGATARVAIDGGPELNGKIRLVASEIDQRGQLGRVRLSLDNDPSLRIGMFAHATIDASRSCGISIPRSAVTSRTDGMAVQIVRDGKVETRMVRVGLFSDNNIEVREGLREGDTVVANAGTSLRDGDAVKTIVADDSEQARVK